MRMARCLFVAFVLTACAHAPSTSPADTLLQQAIDAAGGEAALSRAQVLAWTGEATVLADGQRIELGVDTRVAPFTKRARTPGCVIQVETPCAALKSTATRAG